ncbi:DNA alkylation repair protein, partial [Bacillus thuringiensis]|nr:DNA alkylation repair protein [Bacillus thuringiensis]
MGKYVPLKFLFNEELAEKMADSICKALCNSSAITSIRCFNS